MQQSAILEHLELEPWSRGIRMAGALERSYVVFRETRRDYVRRQARQPAFISESNRSTRATGYRTRVPYPGTRITVVCTILY